MAVSPQLIKELVETMSLKRLYHAGLFIRLPIMHEELAAEIKLHRAVLDRALLDRYSLDKDVKKDVEDWLDLYNPDFIESCARADLDHKLVYELFIQIKKIIKDDAEIPTNFQ